MEIFCFVRRRWLAGEGRDRRFRSAAMFETRPRDPTAGAESPGRRRSWRSGRSVFDLVQAIAAVACAKTYQDARLDFEVRANKRLERASPDSRNSGDPERRISGFQPGPRRG